MEIELEIEVKKSNQNPSQGFVRFRTGLSRWGRPEWDIMSIWAYQCSLELDVFGSMRPYILPPDEYLALCTVNTPMANTNFRSHSLLDFIQVLYVS